MKGTELIIVWRVHVAISAQTGALEVHESAGAGASGNAGVFGTGGTGARAERGCPPTWKLPAASFSSCECLQRVMQAAGCAQFKCVLVRY